MFYTYLDQTQKKYKVSQGLAAARTTLLERHNIREMCLDSVPRYDVDQDKSITLKEMNEMSEKVVNDSIYFASPKQRRA